MKEFPQKGWSRASYDRLIHKTDAHGTTDRRPGNGRPKSVRTTDNIAVSQDVCSQDAPQTHYVLCGAPIVVHFNYVKFATCRVFAINRYLRYAKNYQIWLRRLKIKAEMLAGLFWTTLYV